MKDKAESRQKTILLEDTTYVIGEPDEEGIRQLIPLVGEKEYTCEFLAASVMSTRVKKGETVFVGGLVQSISHRNKSLQVNGQWFTGDRIIARIVKDKKDDKRSSKTTRSRK